MYKFSDFKIKKEKESFQVLHPNGSKETLPHRINAELFIQINSSSEKQTKTDDFIFWS